MASTTQIDCKRDVVRFVGWRNLAWKRRRDNAPPRGGRLSIRADYGSASSSTRRGHVASYRSVAIRAPSSLGATYCTTGDDVGMQPDPFTSSTMVVVRRAKAGYGRWATMRLDRPRPDSDATRRRDGALRREGEIGSSVAAGLATGADKSGLREMGAAVFRPSEFRAWSLFRAVISFHGVFQHPAEETARRPTSFERAVLIPNAEIATLRPFVGRVRGRPARVGSTRRSNVIQVNNSLDDCFASFGGTLDQHQESGHSSRRPRWVPNSRSHDVVETPKFVDIARW